MRDPRFLHVGIGYASPQVDVALLDQAIESEAWDWVRYSWCCYIVWTTSDAETIVRKLLRVPYLAGSNILVCALDVDHGFGNLSPFVWDWLKKDRGYGELQIWTPEPENWIGLTPPPKLSDSQ